MTLAQLSVGATGKIDAVGGEGALRRHLLAMGLIPGTTVTVSRIAPMGDPIELTLRGYELSLRLEDAENIVIEAADTPCDPYHIIGSCSKCSACRLGCPHAGKGDNKR